MEQYVSLIIFLQVIQARSSNIGNGNLYVDGPLNPIPGVADLNECAGKWINI